MKYKEIYPLDTFTGETKKELKNMINYYCKLEREETIRAIPEEMKYNPKTDSEESKTWIAGFNNCRNQILNKLKN